MNIEKISIRAIRTNDLRRIKRLVNRMQHELRHNPVTPRTAPYTARNRNHLMRAATMAYRAKVFA
jgi:hypothetical protein